MSTLYYSSRRGAGLGRQVSYAEAVRIMRALERPATLRDDDGDVVGEVWWCTDTHGSPELSPHWCWFVNDPDDVDGVQY